MKRLRSIAMAAFAVLIAVAYAVPAAPVSAVSSASLSIVPKKNYVIEPGQSVQDKLTIRNLDNTDSLDLNLRIVDFTFTDDGGTPKLFLDEDAPETTWSLKPFLTVPKTVTIEPGKSKTLDMDVTIPKGHGAGSYYSAIVYSSGSGDAGNVGLSASGVTLVFTQIPGKVNEDLKLEKFGAYDATKSKYQSFMTEKPEAMAYTLKNNGNVTEAPAGTITLKNIFGKEYTINDVNPADSLALIGQSRTYAACIKLKSDDVNFNGEKSQAKTCAEPSLWPGYYSATISLYYGQNGNPTREINGSASFWYLPGWFIAAVIAVLAVIAYFVWRIVRWTRSRFRNPKFKK
ncbi:MAG: COG1470 family protein [Candidatus Saccharimonadales bacterium]